MQNCRRVGTVKRSRWLLSVYSCGRLFTLVDKPNIIKFLFLSWISPSRSITPQTTGILTKVFCIFCPKLVVLAWMGDQSSCRQAWGWCTHTDTQTHRQTQATTIPEGQTGLGWKILHGTLKNEILQSFMMTEILKYLIFQSTSHIYC